MLSDSLSHKVIPATGAQCVMTHAPLPKHSQGKQCKRRTSRRRVVPGECNPQRSAVILEQTSQASESRTSLTYT